ncbi:hypothetical protein JYU34_004815 [Plutella xylostella]|uniref:Uncharacterized protein n=1 Tax=Plutella xylostella TaxID=51655 RepID=A0ABQ7QZ09_PLUXY|nr:hypothetical protein JYU34_004815 [Plutella xylostella]
MDMLIVQRRCHMDGRCAPRAPARPPCPRAMRSELADINQETSAEPPAQGEPGRSAGSTGQPS